MRKVLIIVLLAIFWLSGCSTSTRIKDLESSRIAYEEAEICCSSFGEMEFVSLESKNSHKFRVNRKKSAFNFSSGKSFFAAFSLPRLDVGDTIYIGSMQTSSGGYFTTPLSSHILYPSLIFLDKDFKIKKDYSNLKLRTKEWFNSRGLQTSIMFDETLADSKYLVVYTDPSTIGNFYSDSLPSGFIPAGGIYVNTPGGDYNIPYSYEGLLLLEFEKNEAK